MGHAAKEQQSRLSSVSFVGMHADSTLFSSTLPHSHLEKYNRAAGVQGLLEYPQAMEYLSSQISQFLVG